MKVKDIVKLLVLSAELIDILSKYASKSDGGNVGNVARKFGVSFQQLWKRTPGKRK